jgi:outer membrane protein
MTVMTTLDLKMRVRAPLLQLFLSLLAALLVQPQAQAQSLAELVNLAAARDPALEAARSNTLAAQLRVGQSEAARKPSLAVVANLNANRSTNRAVEPAHTRASDLQLGLQAQHAFLNPAERRAVDLARQQLLQVSAQEAAIERELVLRVALVYVEVLAARSALSTQTEARKTVYRQFETLQRLLQAGAATLSDAHDAQARLDLAIAQEQVAFGELQGKQAALDQLVGQDQVVPKKLTLVHELAARDVAALDDWVARSLENAADIRVARAVVEVARAEAARAKVGGQLTGALTAGLTGGAGRNGTRTAGGPEVLGTSGRGSQHTASIGVSLNLPIDVNAAIELRLREAQALLARAQSELRSSEQSTHLAVRQNYQALLSLRTQTRSLQAAERSSRMAMEATERGLRAGLRVSIDVLNAQTQLFNVRRELVRVRHEAVMAWIRLQHLAGGLTGDSVAALLSH